MTDIDEIMDLLRILGVTSGVTAYESGYEPWIVDRFYVTHHLPMCAGLTEAGEYLRAAASRMYPELRARLRK